MKILLTLLLALSLNAAGFWTLSGAKSANVYVLNQLSVVKVETLAKIKEKMEATLRENGITMGEQDSATFMISLEEVSYDDVYFVYLKLNLGEEVQTFRPSKDVTYALTFEATDFIEVDLESLEKDVLESLDFLLSQFTELYKDDNE